MTTNTFVVLENGIGGYQIHAAGCADIRRTINRPGGLNDSWNVAGEWPDFLSAALFIYGPIIDATAEERGVSMEAAAEIEAGLFLKPCAERLHPGVW